MLDAVRREILDQRAAERHVEQLLPPADPERRHLTLGRPLRELQLQPVERLVHRHSRVDLALAEVARVHVQAAREQDAVQRREDPLQCGSASSSGGIRTGAPPAAVSAMP